MAMMTMNDIALTMTICVFAAGIICIGAGLFILLSRVLGEDLKTISTQTAKLAQKGITDDISGLVGNAASLVNSLNQLVKTTTGIGQFLVIIGLLLVIASYFLMGTIQ